MATCNFSIDFIGTAQDLIVRARSEITDAGGTFNGDDIEGSFELSTPLGKVKGTYTIEGSAIAITITKKPLVVGCRKIEEELRGRL